MEPMGNANISAAIVGDINNQLFSTCSLEVLQTCEQVPLEISERGGTETAKSQNPGLRFAQVVELGDRVASAQWWQGGDKFRRENDVGRGSGIEEDVEMVPAGLIGGDLGLLSNTGNARFDGNRRVVVDTVGAASGLTVLSTERGTIGPRHGRRGKAGTEWDLRVGSVINVKEIIVRDKAPYGESLGDNFSLAQYSQLDGVDKGDGPTGELAKDVVPSSCGKLIGREEAKKKKKKRTC